MSGAEQAEARLGVHVRELSELLRRLGVPQEAGEDTALAWIGASPESAEAVTRWLHAIAGHPNDKRAAILTEVLLAAGVPATALDPGTLARICAHAETAHTVQTWACLIADHYLRRMLSGIAHPDAAALAEAGTPDQDPSRTASAQGVMSQSPHNRNDSSPSDTRHEK